MNNVLLNHYQTCLDDYTRRLSFMVSASPRLSAGIR